MNFLITLIRLAVILMIVFFVGFFGSREVILYWASAQVAADARVLTIQQRWSEAADRCSRPLTEGQVFDAFQLRFLDDKTYAMEVRCLSLQPATRETKTLPLGVRKTTGSAGFFYNYVTQELTGEITLELWGQKKIVFADGDRARQVWGSTSLRTSLPASACRAHGLRCCDAVQEVGVGEVHSSGVTDCGATCYQSCRQRPILLSFQTDPPVDYEQRRLPIPATSGLVLFNFVFDDRESPMETVTLDFGDGTTQQITGKRNGQFSKEYTCPSGSCRFTAILRGVDQRGIESAETRLGTIIVELGAAAP